MAPSPHSDHSPFFGTKIIVLAHEIVDLAKLFLVAKILHIEAPYFSGTLSTLVFWLMQAMRVPPDIAGLSQAVRGPRALPVLHAKNPHLFEKRAVKPGPLRAPLIPQSVFSNGALSPHAWMAP